MTNLGKNFPIIALSRDGFFVSFMADFLFLQWHRNIPGPYPSPARTCWDLQISRYHSGKLEQTGPCHLSFYSKCFIHFQYNKFREPPVESSITDQSSILWDLFDWLGPEHRANISVEVFVHGDYNSCNDCGDASNRIRAEQLFLIC